MNEVDSCYSEGVADLNRGWWFSATEQHPFADVL